VSSRTGGKTSQGTTRTLSLNKDQLQGLWGLWEKTSRSAYLHYLEEGRKLHGEAGLDAANYAAYKTLEDQARICQVARIFEASSR
jgi:hypothetical protein